MKHFFLGLHLGIFFFPLFAKNESSESPINYFELGEISAPLSFYADNWDPKQNQLPILLEGQKVEATNLIVDLDIAVKKSLEEQDLIRNQNSWLHEARSWPFYIGPKRNPMKIDDEEILN